MGIEQIAFMSKDGKTQIHGVCWRPETEKAKGVLQITHGMAEYIERYDGFARYMNEKGYLVVGHDHLGHGKSVADPSWWGYIGEHGSDLLVEDMHTLRVMSQATEPGIPYFMLGHSMGSFLLRKYLYLHGEGLRGAVIMGTGTQPDAMLRLGKLLCHALAGIGGWHSRSRLLQNMVLGSYNKGFEKEGKNAWLTKDASIVEAYNHTPACSFQYTLNGFYSLFDTIWDINRPEHMGRMSRKLPLFFVAGAEDPVGAFGVGVRKAYCAYEALGMEDLTWKLYEKDRHEILNELDREQVYEDIYHWIRARRTE